jgi:hypothetical protein
MNVARAEAVKLVAGVDVASGFSAVAALSR